MHLRIAYPRVVCGYNKVAGGNQARSAGSGSPVHAGDAYQGRAPDGPKQTFYSLRHALCAFRLYRLMQVKPGTKNRPFTFEDQDSLQKVGFDLRNGTA
jgi:hypothetical protein